MYIHIGLMDELFSWTYLDCMILGCYCCFRRFRFLGAFHLFHQWYGHLVTVQLRLVAPRSKPTAGSMNPGFTILQPSNMLENYTVIYLCLAILATSAKPGAKPFVIWLKKTHVVGGRAIFTINPFGGFLSHRATPSHHPFRTMGFSRSQKASSYASTPMTSSKPPCVGF